MMDENAVVPFFILAMSYPNIGTTLPSEARGMEQEKKKREKKRRKLVYYL